MNGIKEKAHEYALNALSDKIKQLEDAFIAGYALGTCAPIEIDGIKYYDFNLPSGNLWSEPLTYIGNDGKEHLDTMNFDSAYRHHLPTMSDVLELKNNTRQIKTYKEVSLVSDHNNCRMTIPKGMYWMRRDIKTIGKQASFDQNLRTSISLDMEFLGVMMTLNKNNLDF